MYSYCIMSSDMQRADKIVKWALRTGRNPSDTAGMTSPDEEWIGENPDWEEYIMDEWDHKRKQKQEKKKPKKTVKKKRCPNGTRRNKAGKCVSKGQNAQPTAKECPLGKVLNPKTNRCNKIKKNPKKTLKPCPPGKGRNPKTNRCRNLTKPKKA